MKIEKQDAGQCYPTYESKAYTYALKKSGKYTNC
jgi:hypothetical protein